MTGPPGDEVIVHFIRLFLAKHRPAGYLAAMPRTVSRPASLSLKVGRLFEMHATGWAVGLAPIILALLLAAGALAVALHPGWRI